MPQPDSNSAFYFSHDADMRNDIKVKALRRQHGHIGYAVWCFVLETLTASEDFEIDYNELTQELLAADYDITTGQLQDIISYCSKVNLLQVSNNRLSCKALAKRFDALNTLRESRSRAGKIGMQKRWGKRSETITTSDPVITTDNRPITQDNKIEYNRIEDNRKEKKKKEDKVTIPYQEIVAMWNKTCLALPKVKTLSDDRRQKIRCRLTEAKMLTPTDMLQWCANLFRAVSQSAFLCGENKSSWTASFDWVFENSKNWVKVMEGNYDNDRGAKQARLAVENSLGVGEYVREDGKRTYGSGRVEIPLSAPKRPSDRHQWNAETQEWILL